MNWNKRITEKRTEIGMSKAEFSRRVGVSGATVTDWENGVIKTLAGENLVKAASVLHVSPEWLLKGKGEPDTVLVASEDRAEYSVYAELNAAWDLLTDTERADFLQKIQACAAHNKAVMENLSIRARTVNVRERRLAQAGISFTDRRETKNG
jgi:transcriptional regulator with XRE-family HTH domain